MVLSYHAAASPGSTSGRVVSDADTVMTSTRAFAPPETLDAAASSLLLDDLRKCTTRNPMHSSARKMLAEILIVRPVPGRNVVGTLT